MRLPKRGSRGCHALSAKQIAQLLGELPLTQTEVAEHLGVSPGFVSQWKNGHARISSEYAQALRRLAKGVDRDTTDEGLSRDAQDGRLSFRDWLVEQLDRLQMTQATVANLANVSSITVSNLVTGKTENPQQGTRGKIVEALKSYIQKEGLTETQVVDAPETDLGEPVVGISFTDEEIDQAPNKVGVYVIHDKRGWPTYVGKGNLRAELKTYNDRKWATPYAATKFSYALIDNEKEALRIETILIKFMADSLLVNRKKRASVAER